MKYLLYIIIFFGLFCNCAEQDKDVELYFMGDSLVQLWDIEDDFPGYVTHNWGRAGSGIYYLMDLPKVPKDAIAIVITGTNELRPDRSEQEWKDYINLYLKTISERGGKYVIMAPVFPTEETWQEHIPTMNSIVKNQIEGYANIRYLDLYEEFETDNTIRPEYTTDGLHLSRRAYHVIASRIHEIIIEERCND